MAEQAHMKELPSYEAARERSLPALAKTYIFRSALIGVGLYLAGNKKLIRDSLAASAAIQAYVLYWVHSQGRSE